MKNDIERQQVRYKFFTSGFYFGIVSFGTCKKIQSSMYL